MIKQTILLATLLALTGCSFTQQMAKDCGGDLELTCQKLFGEYEDLQPQLNDGVSKDKEQDNRLEDLENLVRVNEMSIEATQASLALVQAQLQSLHTQTGANQAAIATLEAQQNALLAQIVVLQSQANSAQAQLTTLNNQDSVVDYLDCNGDGPGYDEIVLRTKSGKLVAYFESGGNRFLSTLTQGSYATTDGQACLFTVSNSGQFCDGLGCR